MDIKKNINTLIKYIIAIETIDFQIGRQFIEFLVSKNILDKNTFADYKNIFDSMLYVDRKHEKYRHKSDLNLTLDTHNKEKNNDSAIIFETVVFLLNQRSWNEKQLLKLSSIHDIDNIIKSFMEYSKNKKHYKEINSLLENHKFLDEIESTYFNEDEENY